MAIGIMEQVIGHDFTAAAPLVIPVVGEPAVARFMDLRMLWSTTLRGHLWRLEFVSGDLALRISVS